MGCALKFELSSYPDCSNGQSYEGDESYEEESSKQDRKGPHGESLGVPGIQGEDRRWDDRIVFDEEQDWQDREQEEIRTWQEEHLDDCGPEGKEGTEDQGLRRSQEGH